MSPRSPDTLYLPMSPRSPDTLYLVSDVDRIQAARIAAERLGGRHHLGAKKSPGVAEPPGSRVFACASQDPSQSLAQIFGSGKNTQSTEQLPVKPRALLVVALLAAAMWTLLIGLVMLGFRLLQ